MPHCTKCGAQVAPNAQFCSTCGQVQPAPPVGAPSWQPAAPAAQSGMTENTAACLSYVLGWLTGIIFFFIDKRPYVRFHAAQSIVTFGGLTIIRIVVSMFFGMGFFFGGYHPYGHYSSAGWGTLGLGIAIIALLGLLTLVLWIVCMVKAGTGQRFALPISGPIAQNLAGN